ncbi:hypothetical protein [Streptomyces sp. RG80]|uniref:hypothetical protein n=1 Tax=Streptomyces sp. RG80 TaxID=3157340 RepID=UPI00338E53EC
MIFFQLVGVAVQFVIGQLVQTRVGLIGLLLLSLAPIVIRILLKHIRHTMQTSPGWWAAFLLVTLLALCLQA